MLRYSQKFLFFCLISFISVNLFALPPEKEVDTVIQKLVDSYEKRDLKSIIDLYEPNAIVIGTGNDEILRGRNEIAADFKRDFSQSAEADIKLSKIAINVNNGYAFVTYLMNVNVTIPKQPSFQSKLRFSAELKKHNHGWLILQSHLSAPLAEQKIGNSF